MPTFLPEDDYSSGPHTFVYSDWAASMLTSSIVRKCGLFKGRGTSLFASKWKRNHVDKCRPIFALNQLLIELFLSDLVSVWVINHLSCTVFYQVGASRLLFYHTEATNSINISIKGAWPHPISSPVSCCAFSAERTTVRSTHRYIDEFVYI